MYAADPGSFRDPTSRVLLSGDRVVRGLRGGGADAFEALSRSDWFTGEVASGRIVGTRRLDDVPSDLAAQGWTTALEHDRVPVVSYPYEWPFSMLKDAALLEVDLALGALREGLITKDATPYNVQFVGSRPVHIDVGSFESLSPGDPWFGDEQFRRQFLYPLVLSARRGIPHQPAMRGSLRGLTAAQCAAGLRWRDLLRPSLLLHVGLAARFERRRRPSDEDVRAEMRAAGFGPKVVEAQMRRLRRLVADLEWDAGSSTWSGYSDRVHYTKEDLAAKADFVTRAAGLRRRRQVLDLGANDGYFSESVLDSADYVVAVDNDPLVIDDLYRRLRERGEERVLPLVLDVADPSGGVGWRTRERAPFAARVRPDLVLCLALLHHLVISESIPAEEVVDFLASWGAETVLEVPTADDPMTRLLVGQKKDRRLVEDRYRLDRLEAALDHRFETVERTRVGTRLLLLLRPRGDRAGGGRPGP